MFILNPLDFILILLLHAFSSFYTFSLCVLAVMIVIRFLCFSQKADETYFQINIETFSSQCAC